MQHSQATFDGMDKLKLFYQIWRPDVESKAILAIIHGIGEHSGRYMNIINHLLPLGITVYSFDHRGHGKSPGKRGYILKWEEFREDVKCFLQLIKNQEGKSPIFLMGHSLGGLIVLNYALHHPQEVKAIIVSGATLAQPGISPILLFLSRVLSKIWPSFTVNTNLDVNALSRDPEVVKAYQEDPLVHSKACARLGTEFTAAMKWTLSHAAEFSLPLMIVHGGSDQIVPPDGSRKFFEQMVINDKEIHIYREGFHEPHNDIDKINVLKDIEQWIQIHL